MPQELLIKVDRKQDAISVLTSENFAVDSSQEHLLIREATAEMAREVNRLLVAKGIGVHHLAIELVTLESLFVRVTTTVNAWDAK